MRVWEFRQAPRLSTPYGPAPGSVVVCRTSGCLLRGYKGIVGYRVSRNEGSLSGVGCRVAAEITMLVNFGWVHILGTGLGCRV